MTLTTETVAVADLRPYYKNPRKGNVALIAESLAANGQYRAIVVNRGTHTGRPNEVLAGNHTAEAARALGWEALDAHLVDVDDDAAARIVLADNRTSDAGTYDNDALLDLLGGLDDLDGTGYDLADLDDLMSLLDDAPASAPTITVTERVDEAPGAKKFTDDATRVNGARRIMVLDLDVQAFAWLQGSLESVAARWGLPSNVEVIAHLVARELGEPVPEVLAPVPAA